MTNHELQRIMAHVNELETENRNLRSTIDRQAAALTELQLELEKAAALLQAYRNVQT
jgi:predicted  nucleic acid-binding Zn-ribbon protein